MKTTKNKNKNKMKKNMKHLQNMHK